MPISIGVNISWVIIIKCARHNNHYWLPVCSMVVIENHKLLETLHLQLSFATKIQLHVTHATTNLCSCLKQVAHDIQLHATLHMQHVYMVLIYMFVHTYQSKSNCTLCATLLAITMWLIKIWHMFKNLTTSLWTCVIVLFFCVFKIKNSLN
jgi:hypothetical protein